MADPWKDRKSSSLTIKLALKLVDLARVPLTALGIDVKRLRTILALRLSLDLDPRWSLSSGDTSLGLVLTCCAVWFAGIGPGALALLTHKPELWLGIGQGMTLLLCLMFLFTQYGNMIIDATDVRVIVSLPVSDRTLFASRFVHVLLYVSLLCACSSFFPAVIGALVFPPVWALTIYPLATFLSGFCALAFVACTHALLLRIVGPGLYQRVGLWIQVVGASGVFLAAQVVPRMVTDQLHSYSAEQLARLRWWLPPLHQLGLYELVTVGPTPERIALAALALLVPLAGFALALTLASRHFVAALNARETVSRRRVDPWRAGWLSRLGGRLARTREERAGYDFALNLSRRERPFLRVVVPQTVMFAAMGLGSLRAGPHLPAVLGHFLERLPIAFSALFGPLAVAATMSENYDARWVLRVSPVADWTRVGAAAVRALLVGMVVPSMLVVLVIIAIVTRAEHLASLCVAFELGLAISLAAIVQLRLPFPFCTPVRAQTGSMRDVPVVLVVVLASFPTAALAAATTWHWAIELAAAVALAPLCVHGWRRLANVQFLSLPS